MNKIFACLALLLSIESFAVVKNLGNMHVMREDPFAQIIRDITVAPHFTFALAPEVITLQEVLSNATQEDGESNAIFWMQLDGYFANRTLSVGDVTAIFQALGRTPLAIDVLMCLVHRNLDNPWRGLFNLLNSMSSQDNIDYVLQSLRESDQVEHLYNKIPKRQRQSVFAKHIESYL